MTVLTKRIPSIVLMAIALFSFCGELHAQIGPQKLVLADGTQSQYPLLWAAKENDLATVNDLINNGTNVGAKDKEGITALMVAAYHGNVPILEALIEAGANINAKTKKKVTVAHWGIMSKNFEVIRILSENKADLNVEDNNGLKPLHWSAMENDPHSFTSALQELGAEY